MDNEEWWPPDIFRTIGDAGYFGITVPERYGGKGPDLLTEGVVAQGFARWDHAIALSWLAVCTENLNSGVLVMEAAKDGA